MSTSSTDPADAVIEGPIPLPSPPVTGAVGNDARPSEPQPATEHVGQPAPAPPAGARPGDLTPRWRTVVGAAWTAAFFAYAAVWQASVQIGIGTWWVGPRAQPTNIAIKVLPFALCLALAICAVYNAPRLLSLSAAGVVVATLGALPDFSRSAGLAITELLIAAMLGIVTAAATTGRYRRAPATDSPPPPPS